SRARIAAEFATLEHRDMSTAGTRGVDVATVTAVVVADTILQHGGIQLESAAAVLTADDAAANDAGTRRMDTVGVPSAHGHFGDLDVTLVAFDEDAVERSCHALKDKTVSVEDNVAGQDGDARLSRGAGQVAAER